MNVGNRSRWTLTVAALLGAGLLAGCSSDAGGSGQSQADVEELPDGIFKSKDALSFELSAPFAQLIARFRSQQADPPEETEGEGGAGGAEPATPDEPTYSEPGVLTEGGKTFDVRVEIRGHTSPNDCTFPKYKIQFLDKKQTAKTPFQGNKKFRVNSHCGDGGPEDHAGSFDRVQNEISPIREELAYRIVQAADIPTYRTRLAKIAYKDTSAENAFAPMERHGLMIESGDIAAKRFADEGLIDKENGIYMNDPGGRPTNVGADYTMMKPDDIARVFLAEALLANFDWIFDEGQPGELWNVDVFGVPHQAPQLPIPQDFDLATLVQAIEDPASQVQTQFAKFTSRFSGDAELTKRATAAFKEKKAAIADEIAAVEKEGIEAKRLPSTDGKTTTDLGFINAHKQFDAFFAQDGLKE